MADTDVEEKGKGYSDLLKDKFMHQQQRNTRCLLVCGTFIIVALLAVVGVLVVSKYSSRNNDDNSSRNDISSQVPPISGASMKLQDKKKSAVNTRINAVSQSIGMSGVRNDKLLQDCTSTNLKQTFPDIDYSLFGYNILKGYPLADGRDPGFTRPLFAFDFSSKRHTADCRYMLPHGLTAAPDVACTTSFESKVVENSVDLQKSLDVNAHISGGVWGVSFSASAGYKKATSEVATGKTKIIQSTANCKYYFTKIDKLSMPDYSPEVIEWLQRMNKSINLTGSVDDNLIYSFLDYFGTHFPSEMVYGARYTYENRLSSSSFKSLSEESVSVEVQASYSGAFSVGGGFGMSLSQKQAAEKFQEKTVTRTTSVGAPPPYDGDAMTWASTVKDTPVPVQYDLVPIYDLFSTEYTTKSYFSKTNQRHIRDKLMRVASSYCRLLSDSGVDAACNDASVIRFVGVEPRRYDVSIRNISLTDCINRCKRRENCLVITYHSPPHTEPSKCYLVNLDKMISAGENRNMINCTSCDSFVIPRELTQSLPLQSFTYDNSVARRNKLFIRGSNDYDVLKTMCECVCAYDSFCIGFEMTNVTGYNYNCATYSTHSETLVPTQRYYFDAQLMSDLTKSNFKNTQISSQWSEITVNSAQLSEQQEIGQEMANCDDGCCREKCKSNINCLASVRVRQTLGCKLILVGISSKITLVRSSQESFSTRLAIFRERSRKGWFNVTGMHYTSDTTQVMASIDDCAKLCSLDVTCRVASWNSQDSTCDTYDRAGWLSSVGTVGLNVNSKLMFPNNYEKIKNFKLYD